jgi:hypothetical protein
MFCLLWISSTFLFTIKSVEKTVLIEPIKYWAGKVFGSLVTLYDSLFHNKTTFYILVPEGQLNVTISPNLHWRHTKSDINM